ncbi:SH3 domain-containing protein [Nodosilinea sp. FACHB-131]|uniref:SH3 domain-containing protein n=1 Tax=Cyanophyceae TaxID=3028117 RepID=UPI001687B22C|nr:SH3 domain-containing protein [Nodosilinea sp. FACHB-131]MBD1872738.1 SH3 domain-containing protein [Nodosilinea sp. FACHB-131]
MNWVFQRACLSLAPLALLTATPALAAASAQPAALSPLPETRLAQAGTIETVLLFETESKVVRVYRSGTSLLMNLYNKATDAVELRAAPTQLVASTRDQTVYRAGGEAQRFARINVVGETELEILAANGSVVLKEPGFNPVVGVPPGATNFRGNNFAPGTSALVLSAEAARLRSAPRLGSTILSTAPRRAVVDVLDRGGNPEDGFIWYQVNYEGTTGWVRGDLLQPT